MKDELAALVAREAELHSMKASCIDTEKQLNKDIQKFLRKYAGFKDKQPFTILIALKQALSNDQL